MYHSADLLDPDSQLVRDALTQKCLVCKVLPGEFCVTLTNRRLLSECGLGRVIHFARVQVAA